MSEYHAKPQWLMLAVDLARNEEREFAMDDMSNVVPDKALALATPAAGYEAGDMRAVASIQFPLSKEALDAFQAGFQNQLRNRRHAAKTGKQMISAEEAGLRAMLKALAALPVQGTQDTAAARIKHLELGYEAIREGLRTGKITGSDVIWYSMIETLFDFCGHVLTGSEPPEFDELKPLVEQLAEAQSRALAAERCARVDAGLAKKLSESMQANAKLTAEIAEKANGVTTEMVLAGCRAARPALFRVGLDPLPGDGPATRRAMEEEILKVTRILKAAWGNP